MSEQNREVRVGDVWRLEGIPALLTVESVSGSSGIATFTDGSVRYVPSAGAYDHWTLISRGAVYVRPNPLNLNLRGLNPFQAEGAKKLRKQFQARLDEVRQGDPRLQEVLASKQRLVAEVTWCSRVLSDNRALFSSFIPRGPRWTRDGFDRCLGPGHAKWLRFLGSAYERCQLDRKVLPAGYRLNPHLTEAECDAHLASLEEDRDGLRVDPARDADQYLGCSFPACDVCARLDAEDDSLDDPEPPRRDPPDLVHWSEARERARAAGGRSR